MLAATLLIGNSFMYSFGKVNHDELFIMLVPLVMAFSRWGDSYSVDSGLERRSHGSSTWPVATLALLFGYAMFTAAVPKIWGGWLEPSSQAVQSHILYRFYALGSNEYLAPLLTRASMPRWSWEFVDYLTVLFELTMIVAVARLQWFRLYVGLAVVFHLVNLLVLNIAFTSNLVFYLIFIRWTSLLGWLRRRGAVKVLESFTSIRAFGVVLVATVVLVTARMIYAPEISENALRSAANQDAPGIISPWSLVALSNVRIDINLILIGIATMVVAAHCVMAVRSRVDSKGADGGHPLVTRTSVTGKLRRLTSEAQD